MLHLLLQSCDFQSGAGHLRFARLHYKAAIFQPELVLRALDLRYTAAIVQLELKTCTLRTGLVLQKLRFSSWSSKPVLRVLYLHCKVAIFQPELETCTSRTIRALQSCDFPASAGTTKLRFYSWSWKPVLCAVDLYYKVAIFQLELEPCTSRARLVLQCRDFPARSRTLHFAY